MADKKQDVVLGASSTLPVPSSHEKSEGSHQARGNPLAPPPALEKPLAPPPAAREKPLAPPPARPPNKQGLIAVGKTVGNYIITAKLGEGGMGVVYLAEHPVIGRKVALKAIHPDLSRYPEVVSRFVTEAKSVNQIGNEHIVDIHDFGTTPEGEFYFIMELLQGEALSECLKRGVPLKPDRAVAIARQIADALAASHQRGIIHRDLKPENIFLLNRGNSVDFVKVLDFGLAKLTQGQEKTAHQTRNGMVMGTPCYMSPEQCQGKANIDHRADIYSVGIILFEMLTGKVPFDGADYGEIIAKQLTAPVPYPRLINPLLSPVLEAIVLRALVKPREGRFQTMAEFAVALAASEAHLEQASGVAPLPTQPADLAPEAGVAPAGRLDSAVSGKALSGGPETELGSTPQRSTFRRSAGEIALEDSRAKKRSKLRWKRRVILGMLAGLTAAGLAVYHHKQQSTGGAAPTRFVPVATVASLAALPSAPLAPSKVVPGLKSDSAGAAIVRKDLGGPAGGTRLAKPPSSTPPPVPRTRENPEENPAVKTAGRTLRKPSPARRQASRRVDQDGIAAPSF